MLGNPQAYIDLPSCGECAERRRAVGCRGQGSADSGAAGSLRLSLLRVTQRTLAQARRRAYGSGEHPQAKLTTKGPRWGAARAPRR